MSLETANDFVNIGAWLILFILPVMLYFRLRRRGRRTYRPAECFFASVAICWLTMQIYSALTMGVSVQYANSLPRPETEDSVMEDGTGANAAILLGGGLFPAVTLAVVLSVGATWKALRRFRYRQPE